MAAKQQNLSEGEWTILKVVWDQQPCAAPTVQELLEKQTGWTYSTVKTMMDRMVKKNLLKTTRIRNLILYRAAVSRSQAQKGELRQTLKRAFNGAFAPMLQFLIDTDDVSDQELADLEELIRKKRHQQ